MTDKIGYFTIEFPMSMRIIMLNGIPIDVLNWPFSSTWKLSSMRAPLTITKKANIRNHFVKIIKCGDKTFLSKFGITFVDKLRVVYNGTFLTFLMYAYRGSIKNRSQSKIRLQRDTHSKQREISFGNYVNESFTPSMESMHAHLLNITWNEREAIPTAIYIWNHNSVNHRFWM